MGRQHKPPGPWVSPQGQPQPKEQPRALLSASPFPEPKGTQLCRGGCVTPQLSHRAPKSLPSSSSPSPCSLVGAPHPHQPLAGTASPGDRRALVGAHRAVGQQPAGQGPLPAPGLLRDTAHLPIPPSPESPSSRRASLGTPGPRSVPRVGSWGSGGKLQVGNPPRRRDVSAPYILHGLFSATNSTNSHDHPKSPRHANTVLSEPCLAYLKHIYRHK